MNATLRIVLIAGALVVLVFVVRKIRRAQFDTQDSLFWLLLSLGLLLLSIFPGVSYFLSGLLGIQSPSNFIFLAIIALLLVREFTLQAQLTQIRRKVTSLVQEVALSTPSNSPTAPASKDQK